MSRSPHRLSPLRPLERLEERDCPADLTGYGFGTSTPMAQPGESLAAWWSVANYDWDTIGTDFDVAIYLSRDPVFGPGDVALSRRTLPPGFPGYFAIPTQSDSLTLPTASHSIWNGSGTYYLGLRVDDTNRVYEWNEGNNSGTGAGIDFAPIQVTMPGGGSGGGGGDDGGDDGDGGGGDDGGGVLDELPATGYKAGSVLTAMLTAIASDYREMANEDKQMRAALGRRMTLPNRSIELTALANIVTTLNRVLTPLANGRVASVKLGKMIIDREGLEQLERGIAFVYDIAPPASTMASFSVAGAAVPMARAALSDTPPSLSALACKEERKDVDTYRNTIERSRNNLSTAMTTVLRSEEYGKSVGTLLANIYEWKTSQKLNNAIRDLAACEERYQQANRDRFVQQWNEAEEIARRRRAFDEFFSDSNEKLPVPLDKSESQLLQLLRKMKEMNEQIQQREDWFNQFNRNRYLPGNWKGTFNTPTPFGGRDEGAFTLTFKASPDGVTSTGTLSFKFQVWSMDGRVIRTATTTATFKGSLDSFGAFRGEAVFNVPGQGRQTKSFSWQMWADGSVTGSLYQDSLTSFSVQPAKAKSPPTFLS